MFCSSLEVILSDPKTTILLRLSAFQGIFFSSFSQGIFSEISIHLHCIAGHYQEGGVQLSVIKVVILANRKGHKQFSHPIKTRSKYMQLTRSAGKRVLTFGFGYSSDWMKMWREFF